MIAVLSPAKRIEPTRREGLALTLPAGQQKAGRLAALLREYAPWQLESVLRTGPALALAAYADYQRFDEGARTGAAALSYRGLAFGHLSAGTLDDGTLQYAQEHLRILSALYGPLRPLDEMARAARELSARQRAQESRGFDDEKVHDLEAALGRLSQPGEQLHMGDRELAGLEEAINSLLKRMHESYQQQARFVSDASHELRTPIAVIQGYANLLARWGKRDEKVLEESIAALQSEANYMKKLVEQLLFLARGDIGKNKLEMRPLSLSDLMREVCEDCRLIDAAHEYRLQCEEDVRTVGDVDMLKQCARILTDNAVKYTPEGGAILLRAYQNAAGEACFAVQDSGIGIPPEDVKHVFERFYRADPARSRNSGGTGLGLSIAKWIVSRHGGHIEVLSREGLGTRFTVCLRGGGVSER